MKIFTYSSSYRDKSNTELIINSIVNKISSTEEVIWYKHTAKDLKLEYCRGCCACFKKGYCSMDKEDSFDKIKSEMMEADVIILGSPVYSAMVSGAMKVFIDRLSYFLHTMQLRGKMIIPVLSASGNSLLETNTYFKRMIESWGGYAPISILFTVDAPNMLESKEFMEVVLPKYIEEIRRTGTNRVNKKSSSYQEMYFQQLKKTYFMPSEDAEYKYWKNSGMLFKNSFQDVLDEKI